MTSAPSASRYSPKQRESDYDRMFRADHIDENQSKICCDRAILQHGFLRDGPRHAAVSVGCSGRQGALGSAL